MTMDEDRERYSAKRDRLARLARVVSILEAHPEGIRPPDIAARMAVAVRTVYRDLTALQDELRLPVWGENGVWGIDAEKAFLPPLKLTQQEAMAVVLSARLMVRYADKYDPDLAAAFEKLERGLPSPLAEHVERTLDTLSKAPRDERFRGARPAPDEGLGRTAGGDDRLRARELRGRRRTPPGDRSAIPPRAIAPDARALSHGLRRDARRAADVQDRTDPLGRADAADVRAARRCGDDLGIATGLGHHRGPTASRRGPAVRAGRRKPGMEATWHPTQTVKAEADGSLRLACDGIGNDRDPPLDPVLGRGCRGPRAGGVAGRCGGHAPAGA